MKKKLMFILSAGVLSIGMLAGCSSGQEGEPVNTDTETNVEAPSSSDLPSNAEESKPTSGDMSQTEKGETTTPEENKDVVEGEIEGEISTETNVKDEVKSNDGSELKESNESVGTEGMEEENMGANQ